jgi:hypothetical protein
MRAPVVVRHRLTDTPLARRHARLLAHRPGRKAVVIPWDAFDPERHPAPARELAAHAQQKLALGEYAAVDLFSGLVSALARHGAPFDLVAAASQIPCDEIRHADYALRMAQRLLGREVALTWDAGASSAWRALESIEDVDALMAEMVAVGETLACALLSACAARATDPTLHALFSTIVTDEVHHARLGWYYLAWRAPSWSLAERQRLADRVGLSVLHTEERFSRGRDAPEGFRKAARALGVLDSPTQRRVTCDVMEREIVPALDALGLGASHAWAARRKLPSRRVY